MADTNEVKTRRPRRSKADIEDAIQKAAVSQIKKKGFSMALVTDIVRKAKIEPIVFYNRYKNLDEFYDEFVKKYDYWMSDLIHDSVDEIASEEGYSNVIEKLMNNLLDDEIMIELLRWEVADGNHITERTSRLRELHILELINKYAAAIKSRELDLVAITTLLVAGIYYFILHKDRSTFSGIDLNTHEGKHRLVKAIRSLAAMMFHQSDNARMAVEGNDLHEVEAYRRRFEDACRERVDTDFRSHVEELVKAREAAERRRIADSLRAEGVSPDVIARCLG